jgi:hypothetical protein
MAARLHPSPGGAGPRGLPGVGGAIVINVCDELDLEPDSSGPNVGTDFGAGVNAICASLPQDSTATLYFKPSPTPGVGYRFSQTIRPRRPVKLLGEGRWRGVFGSVFYFDWWTPGLIIDSLESSGTNTSAAGIIVDGIGFSAPPIPIRSELTDGEPYFIGQIVRIQKSKGFLYEAQNSGTAGTLDETPWPTTPGLTVVDGTVTWVCKEQIHGITVWAQPWIINCFVRNFGGHGIFIYGQAGGVPRTNANGFKLEHTMSRDNAGYGVYIPPCSDAQAGRAMNASCHFNGQGGIHDHSEVGNIWDNCELEHNGWTVGEVNHASWQSQASFFSQNGQTILISPYMEGGCPLRTPGRGAVLGGNIFVPWETPWPQYGFEMRPRLIVQNGLTGILAEDRLWDFEINNSTAPDDQAKAFGFKNIRGTQEHWRFDQGRSNVLAQSRMWGFNSINLDDYIAGFPGLERGQTSKWVMNEAQLGGDWTTWAKRIGSGPHFKTNGQRVQRGAVYELAGTAFVPGTISRHLAKYPGDNGADGGMAYPRWTANTPYTVGQVVTDSNGNLQRRTVVGTSHLTTEPTWSTVFGNTTNDNGVVNAWTAGLDIPDFQSNFAYSQGALWKPNPRNGYTYRVNLAANSGAGTPSGALLGGQWGETMQHNNLRFLRYGFDFRGVFWYPEGSATPI